MYFPKWAHFIYVSRRWLALAQVFAYCIWGVTNDWKCSAVQMCRGTVQLAGERTDIGIISHTYISHTCISHTCISHTCISHTCISHTCISHACISLTCILLLHKSAGALCSWGADRYWYNFSYLPRLLYSHPPSKHGENIFAPTWWAC